MRETDVVIIGGGHNGLVCSAYLATAGLKVTVLERRHIVGGAAVTEEFHPGFRNSVASYTVSLLNEKVIADLDLHAHGLKIIHRPLANFLPTEDGRYLKIGGGKTLSEIAKFSVRDAEVHDSYHAKLDTIADVLRDLVLETPPNVSIAGWMDALPELLGIARLGNKMRRLDMAERRTLLDLFTRSAGEYLDGWFESDPVKAVYGYDGIVGNYASPYAAGSAYVLLHHVFGVVNGVKGVWGHAVGGMGAITQAMARAAVARGVDIRVDAGVAEVIVEKGRAVGVVTTKGDVVRARGGGERPSDDALPRPDRPHAFGRRFPPPDRAIPLGIGHVPHERGFERIAELRLPTRHGGRRASPGGADHRADAWLYGPSVARRAREGLVGQAGDRDADPVHHGR